MKSPKLSRRSAIQSVLGMAGTGLLLPESSYAANPAPFRDYSKVKITKLETFLVKPRWIFLKIHTDVGVYGLGEPLLEGRALTIQAAIKEVEPYLIGKDPRAVVHHWQAIYRHAFYRGGPILTSGPQRHRPRPVGHQRQTPERTRLRTPRRPHPRPRQGIWPGQQCRTNQAAKSARVHRH